MTAKLNTASVSAAAGKSVSQGAVSRKPPVPSRSIRPQEGSGGGAPKPRKLNDASATMACSKSEAASTAIGPAPLGSTCRTRIRSCPAPAASAAVT